MRAMRGLGVVFNTLVSKLNHCEAPEGGGEVKIEVERGVITFSSLCIENTTPIFCTEIVAHSRATKKSFYISSAVSYLF